LPIAIVLAKKIIIFSPNKSIKNETGNAALKASPIPKKEKERKRKESKKI